MATEKFTDDKKSKTDTASPIREEPRQALRHDPNRDIADYIEEEENDRLRIPKSEYPDGFDLQWVTHSIFGQPQTQHRAGFERKGWVPVLDDDFDGKFGRKFMPDKFKGEVEVEGLVLMARPKTFSARAKALDQERAKQAVQIKERQLKGGDIDGVTLDTKHPSAMRANRINRSMETIAVPDDN